MSVTNDQKTELLFKQFNNVVNAGPSNSFSTDTVNKYPFRNYVTNEEIFSNNIPADLSNVTFTSSSSGATFIGLEALDISNEEAGSPNGTVFPIPNTDLTFYYRLELETATNVTARTWYKDDGTGRNNSILRDSIPFNYDSSLNTYKPKLFPLGSNIDIPIFSNNQGQLFWLLDYKSGFVEFYGATSDINTWVSANTRPRISFIKYTGPKGASGGGGGGGGDASFNNVDINGDLTVANLTVTDSARLPENTLIDKVWESLGGSNISTHPFFDPGYPEVKQFAAYYVNRAASEVVPDVDWVTIARCGEDISGNADGRADALFKISYPASGRHETITFNASFKFGAGCSINVLQHDWYSGPDFGALRIAYKGSTGPAIYMGAVLQMQFTSSLSATAVNGMAIHIMNNEDYPGWEQYTDISGTHGSLNIPNVKPDNNPKSQNVRFPTYPVPTDLDTFFVLDNLDWNPYSGTPDDNANQMTTNPSRFTRRVEMQENLQVGGNVLLPTGNVLASQGLGLFNGLNVTNDGTIGQSLTVNDDGYVTSFETTGFSTVASPTRPYLAELILPQGANNIKNSAARALFELIVSDQDPADEVSARNHVIVGTITVCSSAGTNSDSSSGLMLNILHSSWSDRIGNPPIPLISRVFIQGQNSPGPPVSNVFYRLWIDSPFPTLGYVSFKLKDNGINSYGNITTNFGQHWRANFALADALPAGSDFTEVIIAKDTNANMILGADIVDVPNTLRVNNLEGLNLDVGFPNNQIKSKAHEITLDPSITNGDWFTIARLGNITTSTSNLSMRGVAVIEFYNRISSRHQVIRMFVSQLFSLGGSLEAYNMGYNGGSGGSTLSYQKVRIVTDGIYDGALLQIQAGNGIATGSVNKHFVNLMLSTNDPGWNIVDNNSILTADNSPNKYTGPNNGSPYNQPSQGWTEARLDIFYGYTNTQGPRAFTGKITSLPTTFQDARVQVRGENIFVWKDNVSGFGGFVGSVDGLLKVESSATGDDIVIELDTNGNSIIKNTNASNGKNMTLESDGNIILNNQNASNNPSGIVAFARDGIFMQANNTGASSNIRFKAFGNSTANNYIRFTANSGPNSGSPGVDYDLTWSIAGMNVDNLNISDINGLYGFNSRTNNMILQADNRWGNSSTRPNAKAVDLNSPLTMLSGISSDINANLNNNSEGTMIFDSFLSSLIIKPAIQGPAGNTTAQVLMSPTTVTVFDWVTNYDIGTTFNPGYTKIGGWITGSSWPNSTSTPWPSPYIYNTFTTAHDGFVTAVDFGGGLPHTNGAPGLGIFGIRRTAQQFGQRSTFNLVIDVADPGQPAQRYTVGTILEGPAALVIGTVRSPSQQARWKFEINPSNVNTRVTFKAGAQLRVGITTTNNAQVSPDGFNVDINNLGSSNATVLSCDLTMVYLPKL